MKAIYKSIFFSVALVCGLASCSKDEIPDAGPLDNAEKIAAGTYVGEWSRETVGTDQIIKGAGSITFAVDYDKYSNNVSVLTLDSSVVDLGIAEPKTTVCNITMLSSGELTYWNQTATNPLGTTFYGKISTDGEATMTFTKILVENRVEVEYLYTFTGNKQ